MPIHSILPTITGVLLLEGHLWTHKNPQIPDKEPWICIFLKVNFISKEHV